MVGVVARTFNTADAVDVVIEVCFGNLYRVQRVVRSPSAARFVKDLVGGVEIRVFDESHSSRAGCEANGVVVGVARLKYDGVCGKGKSDRGDSGLLVETEINGSVLGCGSLGAADADRLVKLGVTVLACNANVKRLRAGGILRKRQTSRRNVTRRAVGVAAHNELREVQAVRARCLPRGSVVVTADTEVKSERVELGNEGNARCVKVSEGGYVVDSHTERLGGGGKGGEPRLFVLKVLLEVYGVTVLNVGVDLVLARIHNDAVEGAVLKIVVEFARLGGEIVTEHRGVASARFVVTAAVNDGELSAGNFTDKTEYVVDDIVLVS